VQATKDYAYGQKAEFIEKTRQDLVQIQQEVDRLAAQVATARKETQSEANAKLQVVRDKADKLNKQFEQLKGATDASWNEVKAGFRKSRGELNSSFNEARQRLADKIAP
jgi:cob(I)alamin adenosyltransferase